MESETLAPSAPASTGVATGAAPLQALLPILHTHTTAIFRFLRICGLLLCTSAMHTCGSTSTVHECHEIAEVGQGATTQHDLRIGAQRRARRPVMHGMYITLPAQVWLRGALHGMGTRAELQG